MHSRTSRRTQRADDYDDDDDTVYFDGEFTLLYPLDEFGGSKDSQRKR